ncbi:fibrous sheath CABYR-binding protein-like isoform X27 [Scylla paramamosain]|uniref:fibrous sheath CABYR-binding protein-like isoform X27 n=1 Tax=Scylla paramamosain TaxID=85552 RepID=UPI0030827EAE
MVLTPHHRTIMRSRSLSPRPRAPYLWHERESESADRKGWYRVDYGPSKSEEMWYLPSFKDRMNFLERSVERATSEPRTRATSVPPTTVAVRRSKALSVDPLVKYPLRWRTWPFYYYNYRWPYTTFYDRYWPSLGPYSGRIWRLPWYRYPSSPLSVSTYWRDSSPYSSYMASTTITPERTEIMEERRSISPPPPSYRPSATTQLILNRVALSGGLLPRSYPPSRYVPRYYPSYLDYDYGYGGYYYPYLYPRLSRYDYLDDLDSPYLSTTTSYRPRALDLDTDYRDKMLHDHVENMRHRLKSLAYSLDPTGPVPEIVIPERTTTTTTTTTKKSAVPALPAPEDKKYSSTSSSALEYSELPKLASRRQRYYPEDEHMKDNLRIQCLSHYKTTRTAAEYPKPRLYDTTGYVMPESSYRANKYSSTKWEEPDTVFGGPSDKKPYSKVETGSSFFSTYGFTNRKKDYVAEKVRDYYYFGDSQKAISDGTTEEAGEEKKERRKKKKSKERDAEATAEATTAPVTAAAAADHSTSEADPVSAVSEGDAGAGEDEEKERKKLEKKKRKQEREAAAKAAMEAELAALAAAEAELARLEAESSKTDAGAAAEAAPAEAAPAEVKSESAAEKCESSTEVVCEGVCVKPESLGEPAPSQTPPQVPSQEEPEAPQVPEEPQAAPETEQAVEPQTEEPQPVPEEEAIMEDLPPLKESQVEPPPVEEPQVEASVEETPVEQPPVEEPPVQEPPVEEPPVEESTVEATPEESPAEPPVEEVPVESSVEPTVEEAPAEAPVEVEQIEEPQAEPAPEEPQVEEPKPEPPVEAQVEEPSVDEPVETAPKRRPAFDEDAGWLDTWDGEAAAPEAGAQEGQQLGTDESEEPATTQAEEARLGAQDDTEAPADATATTTDAADATPDADAAADAAAAAAAEAGTDDTADAADAAPSTRFDEDLAE